MTIQKNVIIHTYYHSHDVYEIDPFVWRDAMEACNNDEDDALQYLIERGERLDMDVVPIRSDTTDFYMEVKK